mmetsp:Transcript_15640/g.23428  ORF Transcript_15640/g.23428 Transcript_15640/m.23428 type:complete len:209 (-) Transcript_15640:1328-1954(-)
MNEGRFASQWMSLGDELVCNVPRHAEVWILIDRTGDETRHVPVLNNILLRQTSTASISCQTASSSQHYGKGGGERWRCLDGRKGNLSNICRSIKSKDIIHSIARHRLPNSYNRWVHLTHIIQIGKQKCLIRDESTGNDILSIFNGQLSKVVQVISLDFIVYTLEEKFLIVGHLDHQRTLKRLLQPFGEKKWDQMAQMHGTTTRSTTSI